MEPGWLDRQFRAIKEDARTWPAWMKGDAMTRDEEIEFRLSPGNLIVPETMLRQLLAIIHRDGGQYTGKVGLLASWVDAKRIVSRLVVSGSTCHECGGSGIRHGDPILGSGLECSACGGTGETEAADTEVSPAALYYLVGRSGDWHVTLSETTARVATENNAWVRVVPYVPESTLHDLAAGLASRYGALVGALRVASTFLDSIAGDLGPDAYDGLCEIQARIDAAIDEARANPEDR